MKRTICGSVAFLLLILLVGAAFAQGEAPSQTDKQEIAQRLSSLVQSIKAGNVSDILNLVGPNNTALRREIQEKLAGGSIDYQLDYLPLDENVEVLDTGKVKVTAIFAASGVGWSVSGLSTYFVFEKQNTQWLITDTDFHKKLGSDYVLGMLKKVLIFGGPIFAALLAFWLWMLIDATKRDFDDKAVWVILLVFLNIVGAILYYFIVKRKNITRKPLEFIP